MKHYVILLAVAMSLNAYSNEVDSVKTGEQLEEVEIIGFKQDRAAISPVSQSFVGGQTMSNNEMTGIRDLRSFFANFYMPDYGSRQYSPIYIRGIGSRVNSPSVGVYVDGMPYFERSVIDMDLFGVSKVEVLRGPQGSLFGRNSTAGLINIYTRSPLDYENTMVKLSYGSYNDIQLCASTYNKLTHNLGISVAANYHHNDGYFKNVFLDERADKIDNGTLRLGMAWKPAQNWLSRFTLSIDHTKQRGYPYAIYDENTGKLNDVSYDQSSGYRRTVITSGMSWRYDSELFFINSQTSFQHSNDKITMDQDYTEKHLYYVYMPLHQNMISQELTLRSKNDSWYHHITGLFGFIQQSDYSSYADYYTRNVTLLKSNKLPTKGIAAYHVSTFDITKRLSASVGMRFDFEKSEINNESYSIPFDNGSNAQLTEEYTSKLYSRQFTPRFTIKYELAEDNIVYATVAKGFKAGGFNAVKETPSDRSYDPEYTWNYEVGAKLNLLDNRLTCEFSAFYIDWKNQQLTSLVPALGNIVRNIGHSDSKGIELSVTANPLKGLYINANYGYTYARFLSGNTGKGKDYTGNFLPMVPRNTMAVNVNYSLYNISRTIDKLMFNAGLTGNGDIYWREDNLMKQSFYALLNLKVAATSGRFTWEVWSKNTTNTDYMAYYFASSLKMGQKGKPFCIGTSIIFSLK